MKLKRWLRKQNISQRTFSMDLGIHYMHLSMIVRGVRKPSAKLALKIEQATGGEVSIRELLYPDGE